MRGKFIVFEGVEGCGKTTQLQMVQGWLAELLNVWPVVVTRQPGGTELGVQLRRLLLNPGPGVVIQNRAELLLYAADRAQHVEGFIEPNLAAGAIVLCDRYTDSTVAYQGYGRGLNVETIEVLNRLATNGLESDLTVWLDVDVAVGLARTKKRGVADRIEQADLEFHRRVERGYTELARIDSQRIVRVDAGGSVDEVFEEVKKVLSGYFMKWGLLGD